MPKDKTDKSLSFNKDRASPYPCTSKNAEDYRFKESQLKPTEFNEEWEDVRCPVCIEHPHNAVLLSCSSRENGCRPYMCDTSYRHSNCLDQFIKSSPAASTEESGAHSMVSRKLLTSVVCPLCRGEINGWDVDEPARKFMNLKRRSCSMETCVFSGNYSELRKHARLQHPSVRPSEVDPGRQHDWSRLMRQSDFDDVISAYELPSRDFLSRDVLYNGLRDIANALIATDPEPVDEPVENYNLFLDFELDFTFLDTFSTTDHVEEPSLGGSLSYTQYSLTYHVEPAASNNPSGVLQGQQRSRRRMPRDPRPI